MQGPVHRPDDSGEGEGQRACDPFALGGGWSVDAGLSFAGERWVDTANSFRTPAVTTVSLGARRRFTLAGRPAEFRVLGSNLGGVEGYWATPSGVLNPIPPRTVRATLTLTFGPGG